MAQYVINIGALPNDGTGDPLRTAFNETNLNFNQIFAAGPVLSNIRIANNTILTTNTNGNLVLNPNGIGAVVANAHVLPDQTNIRNLGSASRQWDTVYSRYINVGSSLTVAGDATITGNLTIIGNTIQIGNIVTDTKTIQLSNTAVTDSAANGSGITVGANDDIATFLYDSGNNVWTTNIGVQVSGAITGTSIAVSDATVYGNLDAINGNFTGNVSASYLFGNGSQLSGITATTISNTAPAIGNGSIWWNTVDGRAYVKYNGQFIDLSPSLVPDPTTYVGNVSFDNIEITNVGNIIPAGNNVYSLGSEAFQWKDLWVSNNTIYINSVPITIGTGNVLTVGGNAVLSNDSNTSITTTGNITADYFFGDGSQLTGINVSANTGNVTFSDQIVIGTGDEYGGGGLYLAPGPDSSANLQYLRVRGGDYPTHIHFDTGNNLYYDQYLGDDSKYVKIEGTGNIVINPQQDGGPSAQWTFSYNGNLTGPNIVASDNFVGTSLVTNLTDFNWSESISNIATGAATVVTLANNVFGDPWSGQVVITDVTGTTEANGTWWYQAVDSNQFALYTDNTLSTPVDSSTWGAYTGGGFAVTLDYSNIVINGQNVTIRSDHGDYNNKIWRFDRTGQTVFPYMDVARGDNPSGNITGYAMIMGDGTNEAIISTPDGDADGDPNSQRIVINPGKGADTTSGEGGDIYLWAGRGGDQGGTGGDVKIRGGQGMVDGSGGYIRIEGGDSQGAGAGGYIDLIGGTSTTSTGGPIQIQSGQGVAGANIDLTGGTGTAGPGGSININGGVSANGLAEYGNVAVTAGASTWTFDNGGNLTLPDSTSFQNFGPGSAEWHAGANGYVSLASNNGNTYMWVDNNGAYIGTNWIPGSYVWTFANTGSMTAPGAINVGDMSIGTVPGDITANANTGITVNVSGPDGGFAVNYLDEVGNANTSGGELAFSSETGNATYRISLSDDLGDGFATKIWRFDGTGNINLPAGGNIVGVTATNNGHINWVGNSSGDGYGYTTLNLVPDDTVNDSYLILDPTAPNHIHIRAGGTQDNSGSQLYLGGENSYFKVDNGLNPNVYVSANSYVWTFGSSGPYGELTLPGEGIIRAIDDSINLVSFNTTTGNANSVYLGSSGGLGFSDQEIGGNWLEIFRNGTEPQIGVPVGRGNLNIQTAQGNTVYNWTFDNTGNFTASGAISTTGNITAGNFIGAGSNVDIVAGSYDWTFVNDGNLLLPGNTFAVKYANGTTVSLGGNYGDSNVTTLLGNLGSNNISTTGNVTAGNLIGNIQLTGNIQGTSANVELVAGTYTFTFDNTGVATFPTIGGDEGGEIHLGIPAANTTLQNSVKIDVYQDRIRFFEGSANAKGAYIDIANCANGVATAIGYRDIPQITFSANATAAIADAGKHFYSTTAGNLALTLPDNSSVAFPTGATLTVVVNAAGNVLVNQGTGVSLYQAGASATGNRVVGAYGLATVMKVAANTWVISGTGVY